MIGRAFLCVCLFIGTFLSCRVSTGQEGTVYSLVSEINPIHGDSFILPLTDPQHIAAADRKEKARQAFRPYRVFL